MAPAPAPLGIVDWGIGGFGLVERLRARAGPDAVVYLSDTGAAPYGTVAGGILAARLRWTVEVLAERGCDRVVLACNAASTVVGRLGTSPVPVEGIIRAGIEAVPEDLRGTVGVVGGRRTIASGIYRRALQRPGRRVVSRVAQPLSAHIEAGRTDGPAFRADLDRIVGPLRGADALVLACTHYPAAAAAFRAALPGTRLLDPAEVLARRLAPPGSGGPIEVACLTTGDPGATAAAAQRAWGIALDAVEQLDGTRGPATDSRG